MIRLAFEQGTIPIESYVDYYFFFVEKNSAKLKKNVQASINADNLDWVVRGVITFLSFEKKKRKGKERLLFFRSNFERNL